MCRKSTLYSCSKRPLYSSGRDSKGRTRTPDQPRFPAPALQISLSGTRTRHLAFRHPHFKPRFPASLLHTSLSGTRISNLAFRQPRSKPCFRPRLLAAAFPISFSGTATPNLAFWHLHYLPCFPAPAPAPNCWRKWSGTSCLRVSDSVYGKRLYKSQAVTVSALRKMCPTFEY